MNNQHRARARASACFVLSFLLNSKCTQFFKLTIYSLTSRESSLVLMYFLSLGLRRAKRKEKQTKKDGRESHIIPISSSSSPCLSRMGSLLSSVPRAHTHTYTPSRCFSCLAGLSSRGRAESFIFIFFRAVFPLFFFFRLRSRLLRPRRRAR